MDKQQSVLADVRSAAGIAIVHGLQQLKFPHGCVAVIAVSMRVQACAAIKICTGSIDICTGSTISSLMHEHRWRHGGYSASRVTVEDCQNFEASSHSTLKVAADAGPHRLPAYSMMHRMRRLLARSQVL